MKLVALAGLPGTGKSTLARELARRLAAPLLDKDRVRAALFAPEEIEYSREQDDLVMDCIYRAAEFHARRARVPAVVLDGRTYSCRAHVAVLRALAALLETPLALLECTAAPAVVRARLEQDARAGSHPAGNRSFELHERLRASAEPIAGPKLVLATDGLPLAELVETALAHIAALGAEGLGVRESFEEAAPGHIPSRD